MVEKRQFFITPYRLPEKKCFGQWIWQTRPLFYQWRSSGRATIPRHINHSRPTQRMVLSVEAYQRQQCSTYGDYWWSAEIIFWQFNTISIQYWQSTGKTIL